MQTILGANGQIGEELARELKQRYTADIRIVGRKPQKINDTDTLLAADLSVREQALNAVKGSEIAYFTLGLPMDSELWERQFPVIVQNVIEACTVHNVKLVFFDNTYMYPQHNQVLTEQTPFEPVGRKGSVRKQLAQMVLQAIESGRIEGVICRAPEFYGPAKTQSITNTLIFERIAKGKNPKVPLSTDTKRSLIWTPDASRATALIGNTADAYGQTWHLPVDASHATYRELMSFVSSVYGKEFKLSVIPGIAFKAGALFNKKLKELQELLPRYRYDNIFDDAKFRNRFPEFKVTPYLKGIQLIKEGQSLHTPGI